MTIRPLADRWGRLRNFSFSSETEPTQTWPGCTWINPATGVIRVRNAADSAWVVAGGGTAGPHHENHENGGDDEVNVAGLSGVLADPQTPAAHHGSHENGAGDEISVAGLSGELADLQPPKAHDHSDAATQGGQNLRQILELEMENATVLVPVAGVITRTQTYHRVDPDGGSADLHTILGGTEGDILFLQPLGYADIVHVLQYQIPGNIMLTRLQNADLLKWQIAGFIYDGTWWHDFSWIGIKTHNHTSLAEGSVLLHANLSGLGNDEHTQYLKEKASGGTAAEIPVHAHTSADEGGISPGRNQLTNGGHELWQRGAGAFTANNAYCADRWQIYLAGTDTLSITRSATKKTNSLYASACAFVLGNGAGATQYQQKLVISTSDEYHHLLGQVVSLTISVKLLAGVASAVRSFITYDGTGGATTYSSYHGNNTDWEDLTVLNVTVPTDATYVLVGVALAASCTAYIDNCALTLGPQAPVYEGEHPAELWDRCQRYYEIQAGTVGGQPWVVNNNGGAAGYIACSPVFTTRKTVAPTMTKSGTWIVNKVGQPVARASSVIGYNLYAQISSAGNQYFQPDSVDDTVTAEANP